MYVIFWQEFVIVKKFFSLANINDGLMNINLQYMDDNRPTPLDLSCLSDGGSFRQNG